MLPVCADSGHPMNVDPTAELTSARADPYRQPGSAGLGRSNPWGTTRSRRAQPSSHPIAVGRKQALATELIKFAVLLIKFAVFMLRHCAARFGKRSRDSRT